jgi:hypothetical protein
VIARVANQAPANTAESNYAMHTLDPDDEQFKVENKLQQRRPKQWDILRNYSKKQALVMSAERTKRTKKIYHF